jgi:hypothetical protein
MHSRIPNSERQVPTLMMIYLSISRFPLKERGNVAGRDWEGSQNYSGGIKLRKIGLVDFQASQ